MDVHSKKPHPANELSNFFPHRFIFEDVPCNSMEGLLQSFRYKSPRVQRKVCLLTGIEAKRKGRRSRDWRQTQTLWWKGRAYKRRSRAYQELLTGAFDALFQNPRFREALFASGNTRLTHKIGSPHVTQTILTEREFCGQLTRLRTQLAKTGSK